MNPDYLAPIRPRSPAETAAAILWCMGLLMLLCGVYFVVQHYAAMFDLPIWTMTGRALLQALAERLAP